MKFRPRFSVRTLAIVVTLVCAYIPLLDAYQSKGTPNGITILAIIVTLAVSVLLSWGGDKEETPKSLEGRPFDP